MLLDEFRELSKAHGGIREIRLLKSVNGLVIVFMDGKHQAVEIENEGIKSVPISIEGAIALIQNLPLPD